MFCIPSLTSGCVGTRRCVPRPPARLVARLSSFLRDAQTSEKKRFELLNFAQHSTLFQELSHRKCMPATVKLLKHRVVSLVNTSPVMQFRHAPKQGHAHITNTASLYWKGYIPHGKSLRNITVGMMNAVLRFACLLCVAVSLCLGDVYMHNPRGSNNRLNEQSANRNNADRLFDSQVRQIALSRTQSSAIDVNVYNF